MSLVNWGPQNLPPNGYSKNTATHTAYDHCLWFENFVSWDTLLNGLQQNVSEEFTTDMPPAIVARVLGFALRLAPNDAGRDYLVHNILICEKDPGLLARLAHLYVYGLCRIFYSPRGPTLDMSSTDTPRLSFEVVANGSAILSSSFTSDTARLRVQTLLRDNIRCVFTGHMDTNQRLKHQRATGDYPHGQGAPTNVAHIISQSLSENIEGGSPAAVAKFQWAGTAGVMLERYGAFKAEELGDEVLHSPMNVFTASVPPRHLFNDLQLWLTPAITMDGETQITIPNTYEVEYRPGVDMEVPGGLSSHVTFDTYEVDGIFIPAPDPRLIALHAACARAVNISGAAKYIEERYRDTDPIAVMTAPNAVYELTRALTAIQMISGRA